MQLDEVLEKLYAKADPKVALRKQLDFGIPMENTLGLYMADLNKLAREIKKDSNLALKLIDTEIYEARILAAKIFRIQDLTIELMNQWVQFFNTWEICDAYCMQLFKYHKDSWLLMQDWVEQEATFVKRAGFVVMATYGQGFKETPNHQYDICYGIILKHAKDPRNFVKKAVNWAVREIGKRNEDLREHVIKFCNETLNIKDPTAQWIAKDALRELENPNVRIRNYPKSHYV